MRSLPIAQKSARRELNGPETDRPHPLQGRTTQHSPLDRVGPPRGRRDPRGRLRLDRRHAGDRPPDRHLPRDPARIRQLRQFPQLGDSPSREPVGPGRRRRRASDPVLGRGDPRPPPPRTPERRLLDPSREPLSRPSHPLQRVADRPRASAVPPRPGPLPGPGLPRTHGHCLRRRRASPRASPPLPLLVVRRVLSQVPRLHPAPGQTLARAGEASQSLRLAGRRPAAFPARLRAQARVPRRPGGPPGVRVGRVLLVHEAGEALGVEPRASAARCGGDARSS